MGYIERGRGRQQMELREILKKIKCGLITNNKGEIIYYG
jgi:hypothetical protein